MRVLYAALLAITVAVSPVSAEEGKTFSQAELDQTLAPVALYPDALLSQVLMAATYPLEVVEAARWSRAHSGIQGDDAVRAVQDKDWDPSVKSLVAFPNLLARMDENLDWTRRLGDAFLAQEKQVMETVQQLRQRAQAAGKLQSDERQRVATDDGNIVIEQADPRVVYVPYYDPYVVYGPWWWPAYPPVYWGPWPGYAVGYPGFWWGVGVGVTAGFFFGNIYWPHYHVAVAYPYAYYTKPVAAYSRPYGPPPKQMQAGHWQHDTWHRHGVGETYNQRRANAMPPAGFRASGDSRGVDGRGENRGGESRRADDRRMESRPDQRGDSPRVQPRADTPRQQPRFESPRAQPRSESARAAPQSQAPRGQPRTEAPQQQPRVDTARAQARVESPGALPQSRGGEVRGWGGGGAARGWSGGGEYRGGGSTFGGRGAGGGSYGGRGGGGGGYGGGHGGGRGRG